MSGQPSRSTSHRPYIEKRRTTLSGLWSGDTRCVAMLTFDVDGVSGALNQNPDSGKLPSFMSAREYGPSVATPRILEMLDVYGIKATFYVPGYVAETHTELVEEIARRGHEIGHHGYIHEPPATLTREQEGEVLDKGISIIEGITGSRPVGYRSPSWELSEHSIELLSERGFEYDSGHQTPRTSGGAISPWRTPMSSSRK